ncbi:MAG: DUF6452 family protein [Ferruginibacter sp.]|nr:DUF6452 family protein [Ferruginibacter sp.]
MKKYLLLIFIACMSILSSCKDEYTICNLSKDVRFIGTFYQRINGAEVLAPAPNLSIIQLPTNASIFNQQANVATFSFVLNPLLDSAKYIFKIANNLPADTVTIVYTSTGANLSPECGAVTYHNILKITSTLNTIDSVKITQPKLNTDLLQNAKFYYQ